MQFQIPIMRLKTRLLATQFCVFALLNLAVWHACAQAQFELPDLSVDAPTLGTDEEPVQTSAYFTAPAEGKPAMLHVTAEMAPNWHIYSITQAAGGPIRSRIKLAEPKAYKLTGEFKPSDQPVVHEYKNIWPDLKVEEHEGMITWSAPIEIAPGTNLSSLEINGSLYAQACAKECVPPTDYKFVAKLKDAPTTTKRATSVTAQKTAAKYKHALAHVSFSGELQASAVPAGKTTAIKITAEPDAKWHIYALAAKDPKEVSKPTLIVFEPAKGLTFGTPKPSAQPTKKPSATQLGAIEQYYEQPVSWEIPVSVAADVPPGNYTIRGFVGYQTCMDNQCDSPRGARFTAKLTVGNNSEAKPEALTFEDGKYGEAAAQAEKQTSATSIAAPKPSDQSGTSAGFDEAALDRNVQSDTSFGAIVFGAFFGGMLLNLMPCVFPVIGLKILSFVEQSHHSRAKLISLNTWYSVGVLLVFLGLATVAIGLRTWIGVDFKYGSQNALPGFAIGMAALMFVMALSLLGIWEIPIPGFLGSGKAAEITSHEGAVGALAKGAITTLLGASCSGPLVAVPLGFALDRTTPAWAVYGTFFVIGLGMAAPYMVLGLNPGLLRFLPRPGAWMDTFKHICGFVLLGTMVWVLTWLKPYYVAPTVAFLVALWAACWWIGRVPLTVSTSKRLQAWGWSTAVAAVVGLVSFDWLAPSLEERFIETVHSEIGKQNRQAAKLTTAQVATGSNPAIENTKLPWQPFSLDLLKQLTNEKKTVMVDFTADWCANCKVLEAAVLNTAAVKEVVSKNNVVPLVADYTESPPELTNMLTLLKAGAVPVLAIFPAGDPNHPIVFRGGYTQQVLIDALQKAGPSNGASETRTASMR
jgi:suppressor for copper-sensitivity B